MEIIGAVSYEDCPTRCFGKLNTCRCGTCTLCGYKKHTAIHGPLLGMPSGSKPFGHKFLATAMDEMMNSIAEHLESLPEDERARRVKTIIEGEHGNQT